MSIHSDSALSVPKDDDHHSGEMGHSKARRSILALLAGGSAAVVLGESQTASASPPSKLQTSATANLHLAKPPPLTSELVAAGLDRIDAEFGSRAVTPDFYKLPDDPDDTRAVQAAFDSRKTVIFTRDYNVTSVSMNVDYWPDEPIGYQKIDFNGYWLHGISTTAQDCVLEIAGKMLSLHDVKVTSAFNLNYKYGVWWRSRTHQRSAEWNTVYGLRIHNFLIGLQYGAHFDDPDPLDTPQSENYIYDLNFWSVQNCINFNQPNGVLYIVGGNIICDSSDWQSVPNTPYRYENAYCFYVKSTNCFLGISGCEILKVASGAGLGFRGANFALVNCLVEVGGTWGLIEGDATMILNSGGHIGDLGKDMFKIAPNSKGRLLLTEIRAKRTAGYGDISPSHVISGLQNSPDFHVVLDKGDLRDWSVAKLTDARRNNVVVQNTRFHFTDSTGGQYDVTLNDLILTASDGQRYILRIVNGALQVEQLV